MWPGSCSTFSVFSLLPPPISSSKTHLYRAVAACLLLWAEVVYMYAEFEEADGEAGR